MAPVGPRKPPKRAADAVADGHGCAWACAVFPRAPAASPLRLFFVPPRARLGQIRSPSGSNRDGSPSRGRLNWSGDSFSELLPNFSRCAACRISCSRRLASCVSASVASTSARRAFRKAFSRARAAASMAGSESQDALTGQQKQAFRRSLPVTPPPAGAVPVRVGPFANPRHQRVLQTARRTCA